MIMFNKPSWNNKREGFLRPPDKEQEERRQKLLHQMSETLSKKKEEFEERIEKIPLAELAQQQHFDLDASIEEEANKRIKITQPKIKEKPAPVVVPLHKEETVTDQSYLSPGEYVIPDSVQPSVEEFMNALTVVLRYFDQTKTELVSLQDGIHTADLETSDILHSVELTQFSEKEKAEMTDKLKEVRIRRRTYKKRFEYFNEINTCLEANKSAVSVLQQLKGKLRKVEEKQKNASFHFRIRTDLKTSYNDKIYASV